VIPDAEVFLHSFFRVRIEMCCICCLTCS
jgi:hypothetical protein